jgi:hypothetical protein
MVVETVVAQHPPKADPPLADAAPLLRRVRSDALPEEIHYRDDGCDIHSRCLTCPLPRCRYDEPGGLRAMLNTYRDQQVVALRRDGAPVDQIAERYSLSRRTVFRILSSASGGLKTGLSASLKTGLSAGDRRGNGHRQSSGSETKEGSYASSM